MQLQSLITDRSNAAIYNTDEYVLELLYLKDYLASKELVTVFPVKDNIAAKYVGDFYGLLDTFGVSKRFHKAHVSLNGMQSTTDYDTNKKYIAIYNYNQLDNIADIMLESE